MEKEETPLQWVEGPKSDAHYQMDDIHTDVSFEYEEDHSDSEEDCEFNFIAVMPIASFCRPRALYSSIYSLVGITGSRFSAPFLRHLGLSVEEVGTAMALQQFVMTVFGSWGKKVVNVLDGERPGAGRAKVLCTGIVYSTVVYILYFLEYESNMAYIMLAGLYTLGLALIFPVLDCITVDYLVKTNNNTSEDFACERLYGAISWMFTNLYMACALDWFGFNCTYPMAAYSTVTTLATVYMYSSLNESIADEKSKLRQGQGGQRISGKFPIKADPNDADKAQDNDGSSESTTSRTSMDMTNTTRSDSDFESVEGEMDVFESKIDWNREQQNSDKAYPLPHQQRKSSHDFDESEVSSLGTASLKSCEEKQEEASIVSDDNGNGEETRMHSRTQHRVEGASARNHEKLARENTEGTSMERIPVGKIYFEVWCAMFSSCYGCAFLFFYVLLSAAHAVMENLVFLYLRELGAPFLLMGYSVVVSISMELPLVSSFFKCCGGNMMLVMAGFALATKVISYTVVGEEEEGGAGIWYILLLEPLHGIVYAGTLAAVPNYVETIVPNKDYAEQAKSMVYTLRGFGMTAGVYFGGMFHERIGAKYMYRNLGLIIVVAAVSFVFAIGLDALFLGPITKNNRTSDITVPVITMTDKKADRRKLPGYGSHEKESEINHHTEDGYLNFI